MKMEVVCFHYSFGGRSLKAIFWHSVQHVSLSIMLDHNFETEWKVLDVTWCFFRGSAVTKKEKPFISGSTAK